MRGYGDTACIGSRLRAGGCDARLGFMYCSAEQVRMDWRDTTLSQPTIRRRPLRGSGCLTGGHRNRGGGRLVASCGPGRIACRGTRGFSPMVLHYIKACAPPSFGLTGANRPDHRLRAWRLAPQPLSASRALGRPRCLRRRSTSLPCKGTHAEIVPYR